FTITLSVNPMLRQERPAPQYGTYRIGQLFRSLALADITGTAGVFCRSADKTLLEVGKDNDLGRRVQNAHLADYGPAGFRPELEIKKNNIRSQVSDKFHSLIHGGGFAAHFQVWAGAKDCANA